jgi:hypothetical protein
VVAIGFKAPQDPQDRQGPPGQRAIKVIPASPVQLAHRARPAQPAQQAPKDLLDPEAPKGPKDLLEILLKSEALLMYVGRKPFRLLRSLRSEYPFGVRLYRRKRRTTHLFIGA